LKGRAVKFSALSIYKQKILPLRTTQNGSFGVASVAQKRGVFPEKTCSSCIYTPVVPSRGQSRPRP
jgi:hypothetical protein